MKCSHTACLALLVTFIGVSIANGGQLQKQEFSIVLPDGWEEIPRELLIEIEKTAAEAAPRFKPTPLHYGFKLPLSPDSTECPLVTVKVVRTGRIPQYELDKLASGRIAVPQETIDTTRKDVSVILSGIDIGKSVYDRQSGIIWTRMQATINTSDPISTSVLSAMIPTEDGVIAVNCASLTKYYSTYEPIFQSIATSVTPVPSLAYKQRLSERGLGSKLLDTAIQAIGMCILLAVLAGVVALLRKMYKKKAPPSNEAPDWSLAHKGQTKREQKEIKIKIPEDNAHEAILSQPNKELQELIDVDPAFWLSPQYIGSPAQDTMSHDKMIRKVEELKTVHKHLSDNALLNDEQINLSRIEGSKDIKDNSGAFRRLQEELQRGRPEAIRLQEELQRVRQDAAVYIHSPAQDTISREKDDFEADLQYLSGGQQVISKRIREWKLDNPGEELTDEITFNVIRRLRYQSEIESYEKKIRELGKRGSGTVS